MDRCAEPDLAAIADLLRAVDSLLSDRCERLLLRQYRLTLPQFLVLRAALRRPDLTLGELSDELGCSRGNVTGVVDRLERDGWLRRERSRDDRRVVRVRLAGREDVVRRMDQDLQEDLAALAAGALAPGDRQRLWDCLCRLQRALAGTAQQFPAGAAREEDESTIPVRLFHTEIAQR